MNGVQESWRYSNISCTTYPLAPLDTIGPEGQTSQYFIKKNKKNIIYMQVILDLVFYI